MEIWTEFWVQCYSYVSLYQTLWWVYLCGKVKPSIQWIRRVQGWWCLAMKYLMKNYHKNWWRSEEVIAFFNGLSEKSYTTMVMHSDTLHSLQKKTSFKKNPNGALVAAITEIWKTFRSLACAVVAVEACLIFLIANFCRLPKYSVSIDITGSFVFKSSVM